MLTRVAVVALISIDYNRIKARKSKKRCPYFPFSLTYKTATLQLQGLKLPGPQIAFMVTFTQSAETAVHYHFKEK